MTKKQREEFRKFCQAGVFNLEKYQNYFLSDKFTEDELMQYLYVYFSGCKPNIPYDQDFVYHLAKDRPEMFVRAVRYNQAFLDSDRLAILTYVPLREDLKIHQEVWKHLHERETHLWKNVEEAFEKLTVLDAINILIDVVICLENWRFVEQEHIHDPHHLAAVYSCFVEMYLYKNPKITACTEEQAQDLLLEQLKKEDRPTEAVLKAISKWLKLNSTELYRYCYDDDFRPIEVDGKLTFEPSKTEHDRWHRDGKRYEINEQNYHSLAKECADQLIATGKIDIPKGRLPQDEHINYTLAIEDLKLKIFLEESCIEKLGKNQPSAFDLFKPLQAYSMNRYFRYEENLKKYAQAAPNWTLAYSQLYIESLIDDIQIYPFLFMSKVDYVNMNFRAMKVPENTTEQLTNHFSFRLGKKQKYFNRFQRKYDVFKQPFIQLGDMLFSPMMFFATNRWFYPALQFSVENLDKRGNGKLRKESATQMEAFLGERFEEKGWCVKITNEQEATAMNGDVDLIIQDANTTLFIQLKRTKLRLNLKDAYNEKVISVSKAAQQLNDAVQYLEAAENGIFELKQPLVKWIVTTSYEHVSELIDGCKKINYYDILHALRDRSFDSLAQFIAYMNAEKWLENGQF